MTEYNAKKISLACDIQFKGGKERVGQIGPPQLLLFCIHNFNISSHFTIKVLRFREVKSLLRITEIVEGELRIPEQEPSTLTILCP